MSKIQPIQLPLSEPQKPDQVKISNSQIKGLHKLGMAIIPGFPGFPGFIEVAPEKHLNRMIDYMYHEDRQAILIILSLFSVLPVFMIRWKISFIDFGAKAGGILGAPFKMLQIALKGMIFTLYYSDFTDKKLIHEKLGYDAKIVK